MLLSKKGKINKYMKYELHSINGRVIKGFVDKDDYEEDYYSEMVVDFDENNKQRPIFIQIGTECVELSKIQAFELLATLDSMIQTNR